MLKLREGIVELYRKAAISVPPDVEAALKSAGLILEPGSKAEAAISGIIESIRTSREKAIPVCEDTGIPVFYVKAPAGISQQNIADAIMEATRIAVKKVPLTPHAVDVLTETNSGDNTGAGFPIIHFEESHSTNFSIELILIRSHDEREGQTYKLPARSIGAERNLEGVAKCVIDAVKRAEGRGCPPYIIGVGVAATRDQASYLSKKQLLRKLSDRNENERLSAFEESALRDINKLDIGPLGRGGAVTALGVKVGINHTHSDSFIVDVTLSCWATRRGKLIW